MTFQKIGLRFIPKSGHTSVQSKTDLDRSHQQIANILCLSLKRGSFNRLETCFFKVFLIEIFFWYTGIMITIYV